MIVRLVLAVLALGLTSQTTSAHEFWIEPLAFEVASGTPVAARFRVGEKFSGSDQPFLPQGSRRFDAASGAEVRALAPRIGDRPALRGEALPDGLAVLVHVTGDSRLTWKTRDEFDSFVRHKDAAWAIDRHRARGLPEAGFVEVYSRHAKALVGVGEGRGADRAFGLAHEIVAGANPYTDDLAAGFPVTVLADGVARPGAQVEVFERAPDGRVAVATVRADADGRALVPVRPGHVYMLDSVVLREAARDGAVWESLWANLTFAVPG